MKIYNIFGPNLNMLGHRDAKHYTNLTFEQLKCEIELYALKYNITTNHFQSSCEGAIIDKIHEIILENNSQNIVMLNLGAYSHYSYAIADSLEMLKGKNIMVEVHLSNIYEREEFRKHLVTKNIVDKCFYAKGLESYKEAIDWINTQVIKV